MAKINHFHTVYSFYNINWTFYSRWSKRIPWKDAFTHNWRFINCMLLFISMFLFIYIFLGVGSDQRIKEWAERWLQTNHSCMLRNAGQIRCLGSQERHLCTSHDVIRDVWWCHNFMTSYSCVLVTCALLCIFKFGLTRFFLFLIWRAVVFSYIMPFNFAYIHSWISFYRRVVISSCWSQNS